MQQACLLLLTLLATSFVKAEQNCPEFYTNLHPKNNSCNLKALEFSRTIKSANAFKTALKMDVSILNCQIVLGHHDEYFPSQNITPVVGKKNGQNSALDLETLLKVVITYNKLQNSKKAVRLKFYNLATFKAGFPIIQKYYEQLESLLIVHANIIFGPVDSKIIPVNPMYFLTMMKKLPKATISVGWTTKLNRHPQNHGYVFAQLKAMALALIYKEIKQPVTFAVRAAFVANSKDDLLELVNSKLRKDSLVVWKPKSDLVDKKKLMMALDAVAHERVMLDMTTRSFVSS